MSEETNRAALEVVLRTLPTNRGVVLMLTPDGQVESAALGLSDEEVMMACWSVAVQIASQLPEGIAVFERTLKDLVRKNESKPRLYVAKGPL